MTIVLSRIAQDIVAEEAIEKWCEESEEKMCDCSLIVCTCILCSSRNLGCKEAKEQIRDF